MGKRAFPSSPLSPLSECLEQAKNSLKELEPFKKVHGLQYSEGLLFGRISASEIWRLGDCV